jgi:hypothetical protein
VFVPGHTFKASLIFAGDVRSLLSEWGAGGGTL